MSDGAAQFGCVPYAAIDGGIIQPMKLADVKVYLALCAHAGRGFEVKPSLRRLADLTGLSRQSVCKAVRRLEGIDALTVQRGCGAKHPNQYTLVNGQRAATANGQPPETVTEAQTVNPRTSKRSTPVRETVNGGFRNGQLRLTRTDNNRVQQTKQQKRAPPRRAGDAHHHEFTSHFVEEWNRRYANGTVKSYPHAGGKDGKAAQAILKRCGGNLDLAKRAVVMFLDDRRPFLADAGHGIAMLQSCLTGYLEKSSNGSGNQKGARPDLASDERYRHLV